MASSLSAKYSPEGLIGNGSISVVSSEQSGFLKQALNDNSAAAWGSKEDDPTPFAAYTFPHSVCLNLALVELMAEHMKDLRLIATSRPNDDPTNPAFDVTPAGLVTAIIYEGGVIRRPNRNKIQRALRT